MRVTINRSYLACARDKIEIPDVKTFDQVKDWYVKWQIFHYTLDGENWHEIELNCDADVERPCYVRITDEAGEDLAEGE